MAAAARRRIITLGRKPEPVRSDVKNDDDDDGGDYHRAYCARPSAENGATTTGKRRGTAGGPTGNVIGRKPRR